MNKSQPIKNKEKLDRFKNFYIEEEYNPRNYMFISLGLNTALRVSDLLKFTWNDVYNFDNGCFRTHVKLTEQKTTKQSVIFLNSRIINSLSWYKSEAIIKFLPDTFLFSNDNNQHISRSTGHQPNSDARRQAYLADITFGTNNEFGFDYLRDNMAISPKDLVQRQHNAIPPIHLMLLKSF